MHFSRILRSLNYLKIRNSIQILPKINFLKFLEIVSSGAKKIRQTNFAWALPPKIRTKGRFQGITSIAHWACEIIEILKVPSGDTQNKLYQAFGGLLEIQEFLNRFCHTCAIVEQFLEIMKNHGLNKKAQTQSSKIISQLEKNSPVRIRLNDWLKKHHAIQLQLEIDQTPLMVSSDVL